MRGWRLVVKRSLWASLGATALLVSGCASTPKPTSLPVTGAQEVPPVTTNASGLVDIAVREFKGPAATTGLNCYNVVGQLSVAGVTPTAVHIHQAAAGQNGPVIVPLTRVSDTMWAVPSGACMTRDQYNAWWDGNTYVNVHSAANPGGEIRGQLKP
jgi:CHRD domain-containing protein